MMTVLWLCTAMNFQTGKTYQVRSARPLAAIQVAMYRCERDTILFPDEESPCVNQGCVKIPQ